MQDILEIKLDNIYYSNLQLYKDKVTLYLQLHQDVSLEVLEKDGDLYTSRLKVYVDYNIDANTFDVLDEFEYTRVQSNFGSYVGTMDLGRDFAAEINTNDSKIIMEAIRNLNLLVKENFEIKYFVFKCKQQILENIAKRNNILLEEYNKAIENENVMKQELDKFSNRYPGFSVL